MINYPPGPRLSEWHTTNLLDLGALRQPIWLQYRLALPDVGRGFHLSKILTVAQLRRTPLSPCESAFSGSRSLILFNPFVLKRTKSLLYVGTTFVLAVMSLERPTEKGTINQLDPLTLEPPK